MIKHSALRSLLALALVLTAGACASTSGGTAGAESGTGITIQVDNTVAPSSDLTVYLISPSGSRQLLGSVSPNRVVNLRFNGSPVSGNYRLLARPNGGNERISNSFFFGGPGSTVRWNIQSNIAVPVD